jgi:hypothetical protein
VTVTSITLETLVSSMSTSDPVTSVSLRMSTLRLLREMKTGAQSWDQFFRGWLEWTAEREELEEARRAIAEIRSGGAALTPLRGVRRELLSWAGR